MTRLLLACAAPVALAACTSGKADLPFSRPTGDDSGDTAETDSGETGETADSADSAETADSGETGDTSLPTGACDWSASALSTRTVSGSVDDEGFGAALALSASGLWVGAPHGAGRIYAVSGSTASVVLEADGRLGAALAPVGTSFVAGAPLADDYSGQILSASGAVAGSGGRQAGLALVGEDDRWLAATATGWLDSDGTTATFLGHPSALAWRDGTIGVGFAHGGTAASLGGVSVDRPADADEAGFALAVGDLDGDGEVEWALGAPGSATVYLINPAGEIEFTLSGDGGRFGAALAVADVDGDDTEDLLVGAPTSGDDISGAAFLYLNGDLSSPALSWTGADEGAELGFSVAANRCRVAIGAPGAESAAGSVTVIDAASSD